MAASVFSQVSISLQVALLPCHLEHPLAAVKSQIQSMLLTFNDDLQGIPLLYTDIKLPRGKEYCRVYGEHPWLHVDVETKLVVFTPSSGAKIKGQITMVSDNHVSLLIMGMINASISKDRLTKNYTYNTELQCWEGGDAALSEGEVVEVSIVSYQHSNGLLNIEAAPVI